MSNIITLQESILFSYPQFSFQTNKMPLHINAHIAQDSDIQEHQIQAEKYYNLIKTLCETLYLPSKNMGEFVQALEREVKAAVEPLKFAHPSGALWDPTSVLTMQLGSYPAEAHTALFVAITFENTTPSSTPNNPEYLIIDLVITDPLVQEDGPVFSLESWALRACMKLPASFSEIKSRLPRPLYSYFLRKVKFWSGFEESTQAEKAHQSPLVWVEL